MMMGVAQVMGMKPTLRSFFSGAPPWAKASRAVASGNTEEMAAIAVVAPTVFRNSRRWASTGKTARRTAASTTRLKRCSSLAGTADRRAWSAGAWSPPQLQRGFSRDLGSNGSLNMVKSLLLVGADGAYWRLRTQAICQGPQTLGKWAIRRGLRPICLKYDHSRAIRQAEFCDSNLSSGD